MPALYFTRAISLQDQGIRIGLRQCCSVSRHRLHQGCCLDLYRTCWIHMLTVCCGCGTEWNNVVGTGTRCADRTIRIYDQVAHLHLNRTDGQGNPLRPVPTRRNPGMSKCMRSVHTTRRMLYRFHHHHHYRISYFGRR